MSLQNRIREARTASALTQEELAIAVGVTRQTIIAIEKGSYGPSLELGLRLAHELRTRIEDLFWIESKRGARR